MTGIMDLNYYNLYDYSRYGANNYSSLYDFSNMSTTTSTRSSSSESSEKSEKDERKKDYEEYLNICEASAVKTKVEVEKQNNVQDLNALQAGKKADGSAKVEENFKEMSTWDKIKLGASNIATGIGNVCKSLVGFDKDGNWDPVKCAKNVAIAAGVAVLCVVAAPAGAALAASLGGEAIATAVGTAVASIPTALTVAGVAAGGYQVAKGVKQTCEADTLKEFNEGTQNIGQGSFIGLASCAGLRGISKSAGVAAQGAGFFSKLWSGTKNTFWNPWKAGYRQVKVGSEAIANSPKSNGWWGKTKDVLTAKDFRTARKAIRKDRCEVAKQAFKAKKEMLVQKLAAKQKELEDRKKLVGNVKEKKLLEKQISELDLQCKALKKATNVEEWIALRKSPKNLRSEFKDKYCSRWYQSGKNFKLQNKDFTSADKEMVNSSMKDFLKFEKGLKSEMKSLTKQKFDTMRKLANNKDYASEVNEFGLSTKWHRPVSNYVISKRGTGLSLADYSTAAVLPMAPEWALQPVIRNSSLMATNIETAINPIINPTPGQEYTAEECSQKETELLAEIEKNENNLKVLENAMNQGKKHNLESVS